MAGSLTTDQIATFEQEGYLVLRGVLDQQRDLDPIIAEYAGVLDRLARDLLASGEISSLHEDLPFSDRLTKIYAESGGTTPSISTFRCRRPRRAPTPRSGPAPPCSRCSAILAFWMPWSR